MLYIWRAEAFSFRETRHRHLAQGRSHHIYTCHRWKGRSPRNRWAVRLIIKKYFKDLQLCSSQFSYIVTWASPMQLWRLHCLVSIHAVGHLQCRALYNSCLTETPFQSPNLFGIQIICLAKCRAYRRVRRLLILWSFDHTWYLLFTFCRDCISQGALSSLRHRWELLHPIWRRHESQKLNISGHVWYNILDLFFKKQSHHKNLVREFIVIVCDLQLFELFSLWSKPHSKHPLISHTNVYLFFVWQSVFHRLTEHAKSNLVYFRLCICC